MSKANRRRLLFENISRRGKSVGSDVNALNGFGAELVRFRGQVYKWPLGLRGIMRIERTTGTIGGMPRGPDGEPIHPST